MGRHSVAALRSTTSIRLIKWPLPRLISSLEKENLTETGAYWPPQAEILLPANDSLNPRKDNSNRRGPIWLAPYPFSSLMCSNSVCQILRMIPVNPESDFVESYNDPANLRIHLKAPETNPAGVVSNPAAPKSDPVDAKSNLEGPGSGLCDPESDLAPTGSDLAEMKMISRSERRRIQY